MPQNINWRRIAKILGVIGVVLLLAAILIPEIGNRIIMGQPKNPTWSRFATIAKAYINYTNNAGHPRMLGAKPGYTAHMAAYTLATDAGLNDASVYFIKNEPRSPKEIPKTVILDLVAGDVSPKINPEFMESVLSVEIAANIPPDAPAISTPIVWERGLLENGTWAPDSPWKGQGGHIAYLDGHVEWAERLTLNPGGISLVKYGTHEPTVNIHEALPPGAVILSAEPNQPAK